MTGRLARERVLTIVTNSMDATERELDGDCTVSDLLYGVVKDVEDALDEESDRG